MDKKEDLQKKLIEFQILDTNLKTLQERAELLGQKLEELQKTKFSIEELKNANPAKAFIPLGSGNFVRGSIENCEEVLVGIGSDIAIKKNRQDALKILDSRINELEDDLNNILKQVSVFVMQLEKVQQEIENLQK